MQLHVVKSANSLYADCGILLQRQTNLKENGSEGLKYLILCVCFFVVVVPRNGDLNTVKM